MTTSKWDLLESSADASLDSMQNDTQDSNDCTDIRLEVMLIYKYMYFSNIGIEFTMFVIEI